MRAVAFVLLSALLALAIACRTPPWAERVRCKRDADCHPPACGPCKSGEPLLADAPSCVVNPCPEAKVACSPEHVCVIR